MLKHPGFLVCNLNVPIVIFNIFRIYHYYRILLLIWFLGNMACLTLQKVQAHCGYEFMKLLLRFDHVVYLIMYQLNTRALLELGSTAMFA